MAKNKSRNSPAPVAPAPEVPAPDEVQAKIAALKAEIKALSAPNLTPTVTKYVDALVAEVLDANPGKLVRALTIQIRDNKFHKFGRVSIVKPRTGDSEDESTESEAA